MFAPSRAIKMSRLGSVHTMWFISYDSFVQLCCNQKDNLQISKGPVKLIEWVKKAFLFLHVLSKLFQFTILKLSR